jgi:two-component system, OmpR family, KDP operon response regulator KdpE
LAAGARILVVDDEAQIRRALTSILTAHDFVVDTASTAQEAVQAATEHFPDLVILDLTLPDADGILVAGDLRSWLAAPILVLSVRAEEGHKIAALNAGADDYLTKPFSAGELVARVRALLRRASGLTSAPAVIVAEGLEIDLARRRVTRDGSEVTLTKTEFEILALLASYPDRVLTSRVILEEVWGPEYAEERRLLRVHVSNLRKKIEPHPSVPTHILTEPGVGFVFSTR